MNDLIITRRASRDTAAAFNWYEDRQRGLGERFLRQLKRCYQRIRANPEGYAVTYLHYRAAPIKKFPFVAVYDVLAGRIIIQAVFNTLQDPNALLERLE